MSSNLLPPRDIKKIKKEYRLRLLTVVLTLLAITTLLVSLFSLPSYFLSESKARFAKSSVDSLVDYVERRQKSGIVSTLSLTGEKISVLKESESPTLNEVISSILEKRGSGIEITGFVLRVVQENRVMSVEGRAEKRDDLIQFSESLKQEGLFKSVNLPISNLAKDTDITFNLEVEFLSEGNE